MMPPIRIPKHGVDGIDQNAHGTEKTGFRTVRKSLLQSFIYHIVILTWPKKNMKSSFKSNCVRDFERETGCAEF